MPTNAKSVAIVVSPGDALELECDVLVLKFAEQHFGVDRAVANNLSSRYGNLASLMPKEGGYRLLDADHSLAATRVLFVGVKTIRAFGYAEIREFGRKALASLAGEAADVEHVGLTL